MVTIEEHENSLAYWTKRGTAAYESIYTVLEVEELLKEAREAAWDEAVYHLEPIMGKDARIIGMKDNPYRKKN